MTSSDTKNHFVYVLYIDCCIHYIGVSCDPNKRFKNHFYEAFNKNGKEYRLKKSQWIRKYKDLIKLKIIFSGSEQESYALEQRLIKTALDKGKDLKNTTFGGDKPPKINELDCYNEIISKISAKAKGRKISQTTRLKMSFTHKRIGSGQHFGDNKGKNDGRSKPVIQMDLQGNFIKRWDYARQACDELGIWKTGISKVLRGYMKTAGGFKWAYA